MKYICYYTVDGKPEIKAVSNAHAVELRFMRNIGVVFINRIVNTENKARRWLRKPFPEQRIRQWR